MNIKDEIFEAYGEMKAEQDLLAVGYTALLGTRAAIGREIYSGEVHSFLDRPKPDEMDKMKDLQKSH